MATVRPTKKQRQLLDYIGQFIADHGYSPSYREIMNGCGYSSIATVAVHINNLIARGHLRKRDHSARSLELTGAAEDDVATAAGGAGDTDDDRNGGVWLARRIEALFGEAKNRERLSADEYHDLQVVAAAARIFGLEPAASQCVTRLQALQDRVIEDGPG
jgi:SOS-response transcriptional repressor LexA